MIAKAEPYRTYTQWLCRCDCGKTKIVRQCALMVGATKSCGCFHNELLSKKFSTHGGTKIECYSNWKAMLSRCYNHKTVGYHNYGGRGIRVCEFLRSSPHNVITLIGVKPSPKHTIDRKKVNDHYSCGMCSECLRLGLVNNIQWATRKHQSRNRRDNNLLTVDGETKCLSEWAEEKGISRSGIAYRLSVGKHPFTLAKQ